MTLLLAGPMPMAMITLAPWVIHLLYTQSFSPAAEILRWQVLGDIFKVASVPIVFIFLAKGLGGVAIGIQLIWSAAYLGPLVLGIREFGLIMVGVGFWVAFLIYYVVVSIIASKLIGFKPAQRNRYFTLLLLLAGGIIIFLAAWSANAAYVVGSLATLFFSVYSWRRLDYLIDLTGWLRKKFL